MQGYLFNGKNNRIMENNHFGFKLNKIKKRKLKKGGQNYPEYDFTTVQEIFDALTPENMNRFFKSFKTMMSVSVYMREAVVSVAKEKALSDGVEIVDAPNEVIKMSSFKWIDD